MLVRSLIVWAIGFTLVSSHVVAQTTADQSYPLTVACVKIENYGNVTDRSIVHPHLALLNYANTSGGKYAYSGYVQNWSDQGGGQNMDAIYDVTTGKLLNNSWGITCPPILGQQVTILPAAPVQ